MIGKEFGRYLITEELPEGGMAKVYKAYDKRLDREVAVKVILPGFLHSQEFLKRFELEAKIIAQLTHPNIVSVIDYGFEEDVPYLVMEFVPGGSLKDLLGKPIPYQEAAKRLIPIAHALAYAHKENIIHRDIKPANILLTKSGDFVLSDFGIAKSLDSDEITRLTKTGMGIGTPAYMAPEQGMSLDIDFRVDIYSLGIVLYEMVIGNTPYQADTPIAVMVKHINEPLPHPRKFIPDIPDQVVRILSKALSKDPDKRYQSMGEFAQALETITQINPVRPLRAEIDQTLQVGVQKPDSPHTITEDFPGHSNNIPTKTLRERFGFLGIIAIVILILTFCALMIGVGNYFLKQPELQAVITNLPTESPDLVVINPGDEGTIKLEMVEPTEPQNDASVAIAHTPTSTPTPSITPTPTPTITPLPQFDLAFASDRDGEFAIYLMDTRTGDFRMLDRPTDYERVWWPSFCGDLIAAEVSDSDKKLDQSIYFLNLDGSPTKLITPDGVGKSGVPRCNPDAGYMAYSANVGDIWGMFIYQFSNHKHYQVYPEDGYISGYASWSRREDNFIFQVITAEDNINLIYQMDAIPSSYSKISSGGNPAISPDGRQMTYSCEKRGDDRVICVASSTGENKRTLVLVTHHDIEGIWRIQPVSAWTADGQWIYFASAEDGDWDIFRIHPDGTGKENLTADWNSNEIYPAAK